MKFYSFVLMLLLLVADPAQAKAKKVNDYHWTGVERVVAIGDLHGDYEQYINVMRSAGVLDKRGKWSGGKTHLVQTGDITDRGADSRKIIDHLVKLAKQAKRKGGYIHMLCLKESSGPSPRVTQPVCRKDNGNPSLSG